MPFIEILYCINLNHLVYISNERLVEVNLWSIRDCSFLMLMQYTESNIEQVNMLNLLPLETKHCLFVAL